MFPPLSRSPFEPLSPNQLHTLSSVYLLSLWIALAVLLFDFLSNLTRERKLIWRMKGSGGAVAAGLSAEWRPGRGGMKRAFLASTYTSIVVAVGAVILFQVGSESSAVCRWTRLVPFGFAIASFSGHVVIVWRMFSLFRSPLRMFWVLLVLCALDLGAQVSVGGLVQPTFLRLTPPGSPLTLHMCYLQPTSPLFALAFISPSVLHHTLLLLTLLASWRHLQTERALGGSIMRVLRRDQVFYVLAICLVNFVNIVLVLQQRRKEYRLINWLPSLVLTQVFLRHIVFNVRRQALKPVTLGINRFESSSSSTLDQTMSFTPCSLRLSPGGSYPPPKSATSDRAPNSAMGLMRVATLPMDTDPSFEAHTARELERLGNEAHKLERDGVSVEREVGQFGWELGHRREGATTYHCPEVRVQSVLGGGEEVQTAEGEVFVLEGCTPRPQSLRGEGHLRTGASSDPLATAAQTNNYFDLQLEDVHAVAPSPPTPLIAQNGIRRRNPSLTSSATPSSGGTAVTPSAPPPPSLPLRPLPLERGESALGGPSLTRLPPRMFGARDRIAAIKRELKLDTTGRTRVLSKPEGTSLPPGLANSPPARSEESLLFAPTAPLNIVRPSTDTSRAEIHLENHTAPSRPSRTEAEGKGGWARGKKLSLEGSELRHRRAATEIQRHQAADNKRMWEQPGFGVGTAVSSVEQDLSSFSPIPSERENEMSHQQLRSSLLSTFSAAGSVYSTQSPLDSQMAMSPDSRYSFAYRRSSAMGGGAPSAGPYSTGQTSTAFPRSEGGDADSAYLTAEGDAEAEGEQGPEVDLVGVSERDWQRWGGKKGGLRETRASESRRTWEVERELRLERERVAGEARRRKNVLRRGSFTF